MNHSVLFGALKPFARLTGERVTYVWSNDCCAGESWPCASPAAIRTHDILLHHALRVEVHAVDCDGVAHDLDVVLAPVVEDRHDDLIEFLVHGPGVVGRLRLGVAVEALAVDRPAGDALDAALDPPA